MKRIVSLLVLVGIAMGMIGCTPEQEYVIVPSEDLEAGDLYQHVSEDDAFMIMDQTHKKYRGAQQQFQEALKRIDELQTDKASKETKIIELNGLVRAANVEIERLNDHLFNVHFWWALGVSFSLVLWRLRRRIVSAVAKKIMTIMKSKEKAVVVSKEDVSKLPNAFEQKEDETKPEPTGC